MDEYLEAKIQCGFIALQGNIKQAVNTCSEVWIYGPVARMYFAPGGPGNNLDVPTQMAINEWVDDNNLRVWYDKTMDRFYFAKPKTMAQPG